MLATVFYILYEWRQLSVIAYKREENMQNKRKQENKLTDEHEPYLSRIRLEQPLHVTPTHRFCSSCKMETRRQRSEPQDKQKSVDLFSSGQNEIRSTISFEYSNTYCKQSSIWSRWRHLVAFITMYIGIQCDSPIGMIIMY